ncbi:DUF397 domain-containing protein [Saccharopolyspora phatthalungensis]|uniref:DUF397 domain-containing protein n=1 Tax=Saccharopolyspora phatthalungensis TaxID=664693 RepID=A0A840QBT6_9PSEU|nr:DUF397 domain-containing protein [Saccharopolyspora phatthalungensis]MBB5154323.1 hypothetical protein [Saccharopolyspora phatthalungensis]
MSGLEEQLHSAAWFTSSHTTNSQACVEVALMRDVVAVRDTKNRQGGILIFRTGQWAAFVTSITM